VRVRERRDLRQVRDDDDLPVRGDPLQLAPDHLGRAGARQGQPDAAHAAVRVDDALAGARRQRAYNRRVGQRGDVAVCLEERAAGEADPHGVAADVETILVEDPDPNCPFGAKEASEGALAGFLPALTNAVADAVGIRPNELPVTPEALFEALRKRRRAEKLKAA